MFYEKRSYAVRDCENEKHAAELLTEYDWTTCSAFRVGRLLLVNDSSGPNGAQEYAVIRDGWCIESLTVSWMKASRLEATLKGLQTIGLGTEPWHAATHIDLEHGTSCYACM